MNLYRCTAIKEGHWDDHHDAGTAGYSVKICVSEYAVQKETPKGYWIKLYKFIPGTKWVSKTSRRRFAYLTKDEAMTSLKARTQRRLEISEATAELCRRILKCKSEVVQ